MSWMDEDEPRRGADDGKDVESLGDLLGASKVAAGVSPEVAILVEMARGQSRDFKALEQAAIRHGERLGLIPGREPGSNRAFYGWGAGQNRVEGPTVHLIEALAGEWQWIWFGCRIDATIGQDLHLTGVVVDVLSGTAITRPYVYRMAPAPGKFARNPEQAGRWRTMQMQSGMSRAIRTALEHMLPGWLVARAVQAAKDAQAASVKLKGRTVQQAAAEAAQAYRDDYGVTVEQLEGWVGAPTAMWTSTDLFSVRALFKDLKNGVTTVAAEFSPDGEPVDEPQRPPVSGLAAISHTAKESVQDASVDEGDEQVVEDVEEPVSEQAEADQVEIEGMP